MDVSIVMVPTTVSAQMIMKNYQVMDIDVSVSNKIINNIFIQIQGPVSNLTIIPNTRNVSLYWFPPTNYSDDGSFIGYNVTCNLTNKEQVVNNFVKYENWTTSNSLHPFTNYTCCVITYWVGDSGPLNCINITTLQEGKINC